MKKSVLGTWAQFVDCPEELSPPSKQGPEAVKKAVLGTWAQFMDCPEVATEAINFIAVDWPGQPWTGGSYTGGCKGNQRQFEVWTGDGSGRQR